MMTSLLSIDALMLVFSLCFSVVLSIFIKMNNFIGENMPNVYNNQS